MCARNSACEIAAALDLVIAIDPVEVDDSGEIIALSARLRAILLGLLRL